MGLDRYSRWLEPNGKNRMMKKGIKNEHSSALVDDKKGVSFKSVLAFRSSHDNMGVEKICSGTTPYSLTEQRVGRNLSGNWCSLEFACYGHCYGHRSCAEQRTIA